MLPAPKANRALRPYVVLAALVSASGAFLAAASAQPPAEDTSPDTADVSAEAAAATVADDPAEAPSASAEATPGRSPVRTLTQLLSAAERAYPGIRAADHAIEAAEARYQEIRFSPFFQFTATGGLAVAPEASGTPTYSPDGQLPLGNRWRPIVSGELSGVVPIYTFGKILAARRAGRAGVRAAEFDRERRQARLRLDVRRAYFALQLALDVLQMISEGEGRLRRAVDTAEERLETEEDADPMDSYRLIAALSEVEARKSQAQMLERASRAALELLTGIEGIRVPDCPSAPVAFEPDRLPSYLDASEGRPELGMLSAGLAAREAQLTAHRARFFPDLAIALRAAYSHGPGVTDISNPFIRDPANNRSLGAALVLRWNLDFAGSHFRMQRTRAQLSELRAQREEAELGIRLQVRTAYEGLLDAQRREEAWQRGEQATRRWFVAASQGFQLGTVEPRDLVSAMKSYFTNRFNHLESIREFNTAVAVLEQATNRSLLDPAAWDGDCVE